MTKKRNYGMAPESEAGVVLRSDGKLPDIFVPYKVESILGAVPQLIKDVDRSVKRALEAPTERERKVAIRYAEGMAEVAEGCLDAGEGMVKLLQSKIDALRKTLKSFDMGEVD